MPSGPASLDAVAGLLDELAPIRLAAEWDNVGWQVRLEGGPLRGVLVSLDPTPATIDEAARVGANLLVTHHPLFFQPLRRLVAGELVSATALAAVRAGVSIFTLHTNLDSAPGGTSWALADALGLADGALLEPHAEPGTGYGVIGRAVERPLEAWAAHVAERLGPAPLAVSGDPDGAHRTVAVMGGSGASLWERARAAGLSLIVVDHYASERPVLERVVDFLRARLECPVVASSRRTTPWEVPRS